MSHDLEYNNQLPTSKTRTTLYILVQYVTQYLYTSAVCDTIFILYTKVASKYILSTRAAELAEPVSTDCHYFKH